MGRVKVKKVIASSLVLVLLAGFLVFFSGCFGDRFVKNLSKVDMQIVFCEVDKSLAVEKTIDFRNNNPVDISELHFNMPSAAYREGARFFPIASDEIERAFPNGINYGGIDIHSVSVRNSAVDFIIGGDDENVLIVPLNRNLMPGHRISIDISFTVRLAEVRHRLGHYGGIYNLGNFFPILAAVENGEFIHTNYYSFGDPFVSEVKNFTVSIDKPQNLVAAMSGVTSRKEGQAGRVITSATIEAARDFAIVLGEFNVINENLNGIDIRYYFIDDPNATYSLQAAVDSIRTFSELFGDYPYKSFSTVRAPFLHGGMEYPALTIISDELDHEYFIEVIIHEAAHQWWYAVVGNDQIANAWIDEGLAEISTSMFFEQNPEYGQTYEQRLARSLSMLSLFSDMLGFDSNSRIDRPLGDFDSAIEYAILSYTKAKLMFDIIRMQIGFDNFVASLRLFYERYKFQIAAPENLIATFEEIAGLPLEPIFNSWLSGSVRLGV